MKKFLDKDFLLQTKSAQKLYHEFARDMPIIDYHNHLSPKMIAENGNFENITQAWLHGDHYKWRAMRANGVSEEYCTGSKSDFEKFEKWAETVPYTMRNPLYHWSHLELQRYFGINELLSGQNAKEIYEQANKKLQKPSHSIRNLLKMMKVEVVCTTDDPLDNLEYHIAYAKEGDVSLRMFPTFRPDRFLMANRPIFTDLIKELGSITGGEIKNLTQLKEALVKRITFFETVGCKVADHGLENIEMPDFTAEEVEGIFVKIISGEVVASLDFKKYTAYMLLFLGRTYAEKGWVQQFHLGAIRNNNTRAHRELGPDTGWDSIGDFKQGNGLSSYLGQLDDTNTLAKTIIYNLNPADNELFATMVGNFNDGSSVGKVQWGSGWWFLDQKDGMEKQLNALSQMGLLSRFVGMLTDSRSFLSFPRHEYFRRILCNMLGNDIENGELPNDFIWIGQMVKAICYHNTKNYFKF